MKLLKGWKTLLFNALAASVALIPEAREAIIEVLGGGANAVLAYTAINILLRVITTGPVAIMWISKEEQDGVQIQQKKQG